MTIKHWLHEIAYILYVMWMPYCTLYPQESWDYIGSSKMVYDMENDKFPNPIDKNIKLVRPMCYLYYHECHSIVTVLSLYNIVLSVLCPYIVTVLSTCCPCIVTPIATPSIACVQHIQVHWTQSAGSTTAGHRHTKSILTWNSWPGEECSLCVCVCVCVCVFNIPYFALLEALLVHRCFVQLVPLEWFLMNTLQ